MKVASTSPSKPSTSAERKTIRTVDAANGRDRPADRVVMNYLPSTITTRRPQSPARRPPSSQSDHIGNSTEQISAPKSLQTPAPKDGHDNKFFRASEAAQAMRTPTTTTKKPAFFTASSYSGGSKSLAITPTLRRSGSAIEATPTHNLKAAIPKGSTPGDHSPSKRPQVLSRAPTVARVNLHQDAPSPSPISQDTPKATYIPASVEPRPLHNVAVPARTEGLLRRISKTSIDSHDGTVIQASIESRPVLRHHKSSPSLAVDAETDGELNRLDSTNGLHSTTDSGSGTGSSLKEGHASQSTTLGAAAHREHNMEMSDNTISQPAQTNRKIMDLEIRNTSLLAVNNLLEKQTRKQVSEMKELRKRLTQLQKYPAIVRDLKEFSDVEDIGEEEFAEVGAEDDLQEIGDQLLQASTRVDLAIRRAVLLSEQLLQDAQKGLQYRPRESEIGVGMRKVLVNSTMDESLLVEQDPLLDESQLPDPELLPEGVSDHEISGLEVNLPDNI